MLVASPRHRPEDIVRWRELERADAVTCMSRHHGRRVDVARAALEEFADRHRRRCYAGVSWGKDSTVLAHMVATRAPWVPLVWVRVRPIENPDCAVVRDEFLARHDADYHEIEVWCERDAAGWHATGTLERGFAEAVMRFGAAHISGIRAAESGGRKARVRHGLNLATASVPIGLWRDDDVFAYLYHWDLPVHPAYACSQGGTWTRGRIRVASLGGQRGGGFGRATWEDTYYPEARNYR